MGLPSEDFRYYYRRNITVNNNNGAVRHDRFKRINRVFRYNAGDNNLDQGTLFTYWQLTQAPAAVSAGPAISVAVYFSVNVYYYDA